jgi:hypothetical protein
MNFVIIVAGILLSSVSHGFRPVFNGTIVWARRRIEGARVNYWWPARVQAVRSEPAASTNNPPIRLAFFPTPNKYVVCEISLLFSMLHGRHVPVPGRLGDVELFLSRDQTLNARYRMSVC